MQIQPFKRIILEDYDKKYQDLISKLGYAINLFNQDVYTALTNSLTIEDNLYAKKSTITVTVDSNGVPTVPLQLKSGLTTNTYGIIVMRAVNLTNSTIYPTSQPFITFTENSGLLSISNIAGLPANNKFQLNLVIQG